MFVSTCVGLKPLSPVRASKVRQLKPLSPLRGRNGCLWCSFRTQRCRRFHWSHVGGEQRRHRYQSRHVSASCVRSISRQPPLHRSWMQRGARRTVSGGGFALHEAFQGCVAGVSEPHVVQFPPLGGGEAATHSGVVPKVQTTSAKNAENGVSWARWTTFWAHRCLARCTCSRVSPLF